MWRHIHVQADWRRSWTYGRAPNCLIRCFKNRIESCNKVTKTRDNTLETWKLKWFTKRCFFLYFTSLLERHPSSSIYCLTHKADLQNAACYSKCYIKNHLIAQCHYKVFFDFNSIRKCSCVVFSAFLSLNVLIGNVMNNCRYMNFIFVRLGQTCKNLKIRSDQ